MATSSTLETLPLDVCRQLLSEHCLGRLGVVVDGKPYIFPVNYVFDSDMVMFRTDPGTKLEGSAFKSVVFEIDDVDQSRSEGWSVMVSGVSNEINDALDSTSQRLRQLELMPWAPGERPHWMAVRADSISGRRISRM